MNRALVALAAALVTFTLPALAEPPKAGPPGPMGMAGRIFDPATVQTVAGEVADVKRFDGRRGEGVHLDLATAEGTLPVHLGPAWFLEKQAVKIAKGDRVEVTGSRVTFGGKPALVAQVVKKGDATLTLRDAAGVPAWAGPPRR